MEFWGLGFGETRLLVQFKLAIWIGWCMTCWAKPGMLERRVVRSDRPSISELLGVQTIFGQLLGIKFLDPSASITIRYTSSPPRISTESFTSRLRL